MYGKFYASTFTGSMVGKGATVFAVWGYAVANAQRDGSVEINPDMLMMLLGAPLAEVENALALLQQPDPKSRSKNDGGRRLVQEGQFLYRVINYGLYNTLENNEARRAYNRQKQREHRARNPVSNHPVKDPSDVFPSVCSMLDTVPKNQESEVPRAKRSAATRLPGDFVLTAEMRAEAQAEQLDPARTFAKFCDYWKAASGAKARKHDWQATWRNWCRSEHDRGGRKTEPEQPAITWRPPPDDPNNPLVRRLKGEG